MAPKEIVRDQRDGGNLPRCWGYAGAALGGPLRGMGCRALGS